VGLRIEIAGQAAKRGIAHRIPAPDRLLADIHASITAEHGHVVRASGLRRSSPEVAQLWVDLHPAAEPVGLTADATGRVTAIADGAIVGPGYATFVGRMLERVGAEQEIAWSASPGAGAHPAGSATDEPPHGPLVERGTAEREHIALLAATLGKVADLRRRGATGIHLGLPAGTTFAAEGAIITRLGPRDDAWLDRASRDLRTAADIRPWWTDATDARYLLNRALCLMWTDIRWRPPADDTERAVFDEALFLLRRALPMDPSLPYPWHEWRELIELRGTDDPLAHRVLDRAARAEQPAVPVGYRRRPVRIVQEGWALEVPGAFAERRSGGEWWGGDRGRSVTLAGIPADAPDANQAPEAFIASVAGDLGDGVLRHREGNLAAAARIGTDATSGVEVAVLEGYTAVPGRRAAIRIVFQAAEDWRWAVDLWRSLRPA
jgi:hypothetical protein